MTTACFRLKRDQVVEIKGRDSLQFLRLVERNGNQAKIELTQDGKRSELVLSRERIPLGHDVHANLDEQLRAVETNIRIQMPMSYMFDTNLVPDDSWSRQITFDPISKEEFSQMAAVWDLAVGRVANTAYAQIKNPQRGTMEDVFEQVYAHPFSDEVVIQPQSGKREGTYVRKLSLRELKALKMFIQSTPREKNCLIVKFMGGKRTVGDERSTLYYAKLPDGDLVMYGAVLMPSMHRVFNVNAPRAYSHLHGLWVPPPKYSRSGFSQAIDTLSTLEKILGISDKHRSA